MYKGKYIAVVVPAHNEEAFVAEVIEGVPSFVDKIYPVDDRSTDGTWKEIKRAADQRNAARTPVPESAAVVADGGEPLQVVPLQHARNRGVGAAIKTGYREALEDGIDVVAVMNGDNQMDPDILDQILDPVVDGRAGYAKGNRLTSSGNWEGMSRWRLFGNQLLTYLTRVASGYWRMSDPQNGYTAVSAETIKLLDLDDLYDEYGFLNDLLIRLNAYNIRIADIEMPAIYGEEQSGIRYHQFVPRLSWLLLRTFLWRLRTKYTSWDRLIALPYLSGVVGGVGVFAALLASVLPLGVRPTAVSTLAGLAICVLFILVGMALEWHKNTGLEVSARE